LRNREKQKEAKQERQKEELIESKNAWNCTDKTPMNTTRVINGLEIIY